MLVKARVFGCTIHESGNGYITFKMDDVVLADNVELSDDIIEKLDDDYTVGVRHGYWPTCYMDFTVTKKDKYLLADAMKCFKKRYTISDKSTIKTGDEFQFDLVFDYTPEKFTVEYFKNKSNCRLLVFKPKNLRFDYFVAYADSENYI